MTGTGPTHVFLLGHPRSGTTLLENVLASLPGVAAIEERPTLKASEDAFLHLPDGLARLAALTPAEAGPFRHAYWDKVRACGVPDAARIVVDMDPMKALLLPIIARLFPAAKVVVMRRDPRDVVWSCFRTGFTPSIQALDFTTLDGAARHYAALMALTEDCLATFAIDSHIVRYESLVADFDGETQRLCSFIGADWTPDIRRFADTAIRRGVSTASVAQVRRGLYNGGGQWRRYARQLEPVLPVLQPWVERYGYDRQ